MVLLFSNKEDCHPTPVIPLIESKGEKVFRLNTEALMTDYEFCWHYDGGRTGFIITDIINGLALNSDEITAIWDRRPEPPSSLPYSINEEVDKHNLKEAAGFLSWLRYWCKDIPSLGSIVNDRTASSKCLQIELAGRVGFNVPRTVIANRKSYFSSLWYRADCLALKSIDSSCVYDVNADNEYVFYTKSVPATVIKDAAEESFSQTVTFAQDYMEKDYEVRVTVVGDKFFTCRIDSGKCGSETGGTDWRQADLQNLNIRPVETPSGIRVMCLEYLDSAGLSFGCFDFIVTSSENWIFLECNPNGQWLWVELLTGQKISEAVAEWLCNSK